MQYVKKVKPRYQVSWFFFLIDIQEVLKIRNLGCRFVTQTFQQAIKAQHLQYS